jgi:hypothetical protein
MASEPNFRRTRPLSTFSAVTGPSLDDHAACSWHIKTTSVEVAAVSAAKFEADLLPLYHGGVDSYTRCLFSHNGDRAALDYR